MVDAEHSRERSARAQLVLPVYVPTALLALGQGLLLPTLPAYARSFHVSFGVASLAIAAAAVGTLLADLPAGLVMGRLGLKPTMLLGAGMAALATALAGSAHTFVELVAYRLIEGVGWSMWGLSRHAFITESIDPRQRGRAISIFGGISRIGLFAGPALGGLVGTTVGLRASFFVASGLSLVALVISAIYVSDTRIVIHADRQMRWQLVRGMIKANRRDLASASVAQTFAQLIRAGRQAIIPFFGEAVLGLNVAQIGTIQSASSTVDMLLFVPAGYMMDRFGRKVTSVPSFAIMALGMACIPFAHSYIDVDGRGSHHRLWQWARQRRDDDVGC